MAADGKGGRKARLTKRVVDAAEPEAKRYAIHDAGLPGFRVVISPAGRKTYMLRYRVGGGRGATIREASLGVHGVTTVDQARERAREWLALAARGEDPAADRAAQRSAPRMERLFDDFLSKHAERRKKASSIAGDRLRIERHLRPFFGKMRIAEVQRRDVVRFMDSLADKPIEANRCLALLSKAMNLAEAWGLRPDNTNPCRHVERNREHKRKRFLSPQELARLGEAMRKAEAGELGHVTWQSVAFVRLAVLTGMRRGEVLALRWQDVDFDRGVASLPDAKTGARDVQLSAAALSVLSALPRVPGNPFVLPGGKAGSHVVNVHKNGWEVIRAEAGLEDVHAHDLRHSFASAGVSGGASLPIVGALLGHATPATTARYAHLASDPLKAAAASIGERIAAALDGGEGAEVVPLRRGG